MQTATPRPSRAPARAHQRIHRHPTAQYVRVAYVALGALTLIVLSGAAVRLTGSGLGCPDWPKCYGRAYPPLNTHALIEFSNRVITGPVSIAWPAPPGWPPSGAAPTGRDPRLAGSAAPARSDRAGSAGRLHHRPGCPGLRLGDGPLRFSRC